MKAFKKLLAGVTTLSLALSFIGPVPQASAVGVTVDLGTAASFAVLAGSGITSSNPPDDITGDVGSSPTVANGFTLNHISGTNYTAASAVVDSAKDDLVLAYNAAAGQGSDFAVVASTTDSFAAFGYVLTPGVYTSGSTMGVPVSLELNGGGNPNAVFIFQAGSSLDTVAGSVITLTNGTQARNVFWQVGSTATLGTNSTFKGTIMAIASITDNGGGATNIEGRLLADADDNGIGAVTLSSTTVTVPTNLTLVKVVSGGSAVATDWTLSTVAPSPTIISGTTGGVAVTNALVVPGAYTLSETVLAGYTSGTYSCVTNGGVAVVSNSVTISSGDQVTCTVTNTALGGGTASTGFINVVKVVVNDGGGTKTVSDFPLFINGSFVASGVTNIFGTNTNQTYQYDVTETNDPNYTRTFSGDCNASGQVFLDPNETAFCIITNNDIGALPVVPPLIEVVKVPSPLALPAGPGSVLYTYTVRNIGTVPMTNVTLVGDTCSPIVRVSGDANSNNILEVSETWVHTCTTNLTETHTNTVVATGWANGISAVDIASATVVVGLPIVPPLIHVTKVPSPLTLGVGGGLVTYTKTVTNPGTVALSNVQVTDDKCSPLSYISGDTDADALLDTTESWIYRCTTNLTVTTTNTAVATGVANGIVARDIALATVVVATAVPALPNTGVAPLATVVAGGLLAIALIVYAAYAIRKRQKISGR